jgi:hypothetical protein
MLFESLGGNQGSIAATFYQTIAIKFSPRRSAPDNGGPYISVNSRATVYRPLSIGPSLVAGGLRGGQSGWRSLRDRVHGLLSSLSS